MADQSNMEQGAREVADLLKEGKGKEAGDRLRDDFQHMSAEDFRQFLHTVVKDNEQDAKTDSKIARVEFHETKMEGASAVHDVSITTPGKLFGNLWRNRETVLETKGGKGMVGHATSLTESYAAQLKDAMDDSNRQRPIEQR